MSKTDNVEVVKKIVGLTEKSYVYTCPLHGLIAKKGSVSLKPDDNGYSPEIEIHFCPKCFCKAELREVFIKA